MYIDKNIILDTKKKYLEEMCCKLFMINSNSNIFNRTDLTEFIYKINIKDLVDKQNIIKKLQNIINKDKIFIVGSILNQLIFDYFEGKDFKTIPQTKNNLIKNILDNAPKDRILFDGDIIYVTVKWHENYKLPCIMDSQSVFDKSRCLLTNIFINCFKQNKTLEEITLIISDTYCKYDFDIMDDEYILRSLFVNYNFSAQHMRYLIYYNVIKPEISFTSFDGKNILMILLEEINFSDRKRELNEIIKYFIEINPKIIEHVDDYKRNILFYCKNHTELEIILETNIDTNLIDINQNTYLYYLCAGDKITPQSIQTILLHSKHTFMIKNNVGVTCYQIIYEKSSSEIKKILDTFIDINKYG